jgi:hypothetical protein
MSVSLSRLAVEQMLYQHHEVALSPHDEVSHRRSLVTQVSYVMHHLPHPSLMSTLPAQPNTPQRLAMPVSHPYYSNPSPLASISPFGLSSAGLNGPVSICGAFAPMRLLLCNVSASSSTSAPSSSSSPTSSCSAPYP